MLMRAFFELKTPSLQDLDCVEWDCDGCADSIVEMYVLEVEEAAASAVGEDNVGSRSQLV